MQNKTCPLSECPSVSARPAATYRRGTSRTGDFPGHELPFGHTDRGRPVSDHVTTSRDKAAWFCSEKEPHLQLHENKGNKTQSPLPVCLVPRKRKSCNYSESRVRKPEGQGSNNGQGGKTDTGPNGGRVCRHAVAPVWVPVSLRGDVNYVTEPAWLMGPHSEAAGRGRFVLVCDEHSTCNTRRTKTS